MIVLGWKVHLQGRMPSECCREGSQEGERTGGTEEGW